MTAASAPDVGTLGSRYLSFNFGFLLTLCYYSFCAAGFTRELGFRRTVNLGLGGRCAPGAHALPSQNRKWRGAGHGGGGGGGRGRPGHPPGGAGSRYVEWMGM